MYRLRFVASMLVVGTLMSGLLLGQDKKADPKEPIIVTVKLPPYYSKLGLSTKQRKDVLKIRGEYAAKIEELKRQMAELKDKESTDLEKVLTDAQKSRLRELTPGGGSKGSETKEKPSEVKGKPVESKKK